MQKTPQIYLFDIDGVLVEPRGYRRAVQAAFGYFANRMGLEERLSPDEDDMAVFESWCITSEWDMVPLSLAALFDTLLELNPGLPVPESLAELSPLRPANLPARVNYRPYIERIGSIVRPSEYPSEAVLRHAANSTPAIFPHLAGRPLLNALCAHTRDIPHSLTTRIFQQFGLGSQAYTRAYGLPAQLQTPGLLEMYDRPLLAEGLRAALLARQGRGELALAAYTMRPSLPPRESIGLVLGYAPEAEIALALVGLNELPLIGYGRISFLAERHGSAPQVYLKPAPVQALAAILAALSQNEISALETARTVFYEPIGSHLSNWPVLQPSGCQPVQIHIFEDSPGGIEAARKAGAILTQIGYPARVQAWGIASHPDKVAALQKIGAIVFATIDTALRTAFQES